MQQPSAHALKRLWYYAVDFHQHVLWATAYSILNKIFDLAPPLLIGTAVDVVVRGEKSVVAEFGFSEPNSQLLILAVATGIIWALESLF
jgi:ATP-binding cassette subfamily B protein